MLSVDRRSVLKGAGFAPIVPTCVGEHLLQAMPQTSTTAYLAQLQSDDNAKWGSVVKASASEAQD